MLDDSFDERNDLADGCDGKVAAIKLKVRALLFGHPSMEPPVLPRWWGRLPKRRVSRPRRWDRHPGQGFHDRLRLAHGGVAEK